MKKTDSITVQDPTGRRRFFRAGAAFLMAGVSVANAQEEGVFRTDCDSVGNVQGKNPELEGSDSDAGATADRPGCGRKKPPVMTEYKTQPGAKVTVAKVKA